MLDYFKDPIEMSSIRCMTLSKHVLYGTSNIYPTNSSWIATESIRTLPYMREISTFIQRTCPQEYSRKIVIIGILFLMCMAVVIALLIIKPFSLTAGYTSLLVTLFYLFNGWSELVASRIGVNKNAHYCAFFLVFIWITYIIMRKAINSSSGTVGSKINTAKLWEGC